MAKIHHLAVAVLLPLSFAAAQQTVILNDGTQFQGRFTGGNPDWITFVDPGGASHRFYIRDIQTLNFNGNGPGSTTANNGYNPNPNTPNNLNAPPASAGAMQGASQGPPPQGPPMQNAGPDPAQNNLAPVNAGGNNGNSGNYAVLPVNTEIHVRTVDRIDADRPDPARRYAATIDRDVLDANGNVVIPGGSNAVLVVRPMGGQLALDLQSVNVNGQRYLLNTDDVRRTDRRDGIGTNKRTGEYVGGGAVFGTLLGAIAGGGRGAAIGALAGAAAGGIAEVATRGAAIRVPSETVLRFRLDQPVYLYQ